jgi:hypothetical protein
LIRNCDGCRFGHGSTLITSNFASVTAFGKAAADKGVGSQWLASSPSPSAEYAAVDAAKRLKLAASD